MMIPLAFVLAALVQEPPPEAVTLARELRKHLATAEDSEVRLRLGEIVRQMSLRAGISLCGEAEDPDHRVLRLHDIRNIIARTKDSFSPDFWRKRSEGAAEFRLEEPREPMIGEEQVVDLVKELTGDSWDGDNTLEKTSNGQLLVLAPPPLQRRVARVLQNLHRESLAGVRLSFTLFASTKPLTAFADANGAISDEAWERLCRQADEGASVRRLGSVETIAQAEQTVSAFSGVRRPVAMFVGDGPVASTVPDGLALEACAIPSGEQFLLRVRLAYTKVLAIDEVATAKGTLRLPRLAEAGFTDVRTLPAGRTVVLGTLGPLAAEAELPPHVVVVARLTWVRP
jgi:hypothetical protein